MQKLIFQPETHLLPVRRALLSVSDKTEIVSLAKLLQEHNCEIISTGGTKSFLAKAGISTIDISTITGNPEAFNGRMKSLSYNIGAGILFHREKDLAEANNLGIKPIDLVVCNFYPFANGYQNIQNVEELPDLIDIGGPCMLRAAAKNFNWVCALSSPQQYAEFIAEFRKHKGKTSIKFRQNLMLEAFKVSSLYEEHICKGLHEFYTSSQENAEDNIPQDLSLNYSLRLKLRYGENPHEQAGLYAPKDKTKLPFECLQGKELSYNNLVDLYSAADLACNISLPTCVIVKHSNPCGVASSVDIDSLLKLAWEGDPVSAFGSVIAFNFPLNLPQITDLNLTKKSSRKFVEVICAPSFSSSAIEYLAENPNLRVVILDKSFTQAKLQYKFLGNLLLGQTKSDILQYQSKCVTQTPFPNQDPKFLKFALQICKSVKSNAIVIARNLGSHYQLLGIGAGQPNRLFSTELAINQAIKTLSAQSYPINKIPDILSESLLVSDAFFPFPDCLEVAAKAGIKLIVQPGGSIKDAEVIKFCNEQGLAMLFTNIRHFSH